MRIGKRLDRIERELAALREGGCPHNVVRANKFILEDEKGLVRVSITLSEDEPKLIIYDEDGKLFATLLMVKCNLGFLLLDADGDPVWSSTASHLNFESAKLDEDNMDVNPVLLESILQTMSRIHRKKMCEEVLNVIKRRWGIERPHISYPDEENRNEEAVDLQVEHTNGTIVLEHTRIESYTKQIAESRWAKELFEPINNVLKEKLPPQSRFELSMNSKDLDGVKNEQEIRDKLTEWIIKTAPTLRLPSEAPLHKVRMTPPGVPFEVTLYRWNSDKSEFCYSLFAPEELEIERYKRIKKALDEKCPKLMKAKNQVGNSILLLESNDICLADYSSISKALTKIYKECKDIPDNIFLIETEVIPWTLWILKENQAFFPEVHEPKRYEIT